MVIGGIQIKEEVYKRRRARHVPLKKEERVGRGIVKKQRHVLQRT
jgi:hypothetical protein